eukprot:Ihof_evm8s107 gene=Ihof_evmTU8s107
MGIIKDICGRKLMSKQLAEAEFPLYTVAVTPDNQVIVGGGGGGSKTGVPNGLLVYKWDTEATLIAKLDTEDHAVMSMTLHPEGDTVLVGMDGVCKVYSMTKEVPDETSKDSKETVVEKDDGKDKKSEDEKSEPGVEDVPVSTPSFHLESSQTTDFSEEEPYQKVVRLNKDGSQILTGGADGIARLWKCSDFTKITEFTGAKGQIKDACFHPNGKQIATTSSTKDIIVYNIEDQTEITRLSFKANNVAFRLEHIRYLTIDSEVFMFALAVWPNQPTYVVVWETESWKVLRHGLADKELCTAFTVSPSHQYIAVANCLGTVTILDTQHLRRGQIARDIHPIFVTDLAFSSDSSKLISVSVDKRIVETIIDFSA